MSRSSKAGRWILGPGLLKMLTRCYWLGLVTYLALISVGASSKPAKADQLGSFGLPVSCTLGTERIVQQMPDVDSSSGVLDPLCGVAIYEGNDGWDIRLRSLRDIGQDVPVLAVGDGRIARARDGMDDEIYVDARDKTRVADRECGNGVVIEHENGLSSQYCHLQKGSILRRPGAQVQKGQSIGAIGSSGFAEFSHIHLSVRRDGKLVEPLTGRVLRNAGPTCGDLSGSLFEPAAAQALARPSVAILDFGLTDTVPNLPDLVRKGAPPPAKSRRLPMVAWVWAINVEASYRFRIRLGGPKEIALVDYTTNALEEREASYLAYVGKQTAVRSGRYKIYIEIRNGDQSIQSKNGVITVSELQGVYAARTTAASHLTETTHLSNKAGARERHAIYC